MSRKLVIVGGVAGGATAAARARRLDESATITVFERGHEVSFANCGLPYHVGGEIARREALLVMPKAALARRFNLDLRTRTEVTRINVATRHVSARDLDRGREYEVPYDSLLLSPGAVALIPPLPGCDHPRIYTLRNLEDLDRIYAAVGAHARTAVVVGGGFIGLEMVENLHRRGLALTLVERLPQVMPPLDPEVAERLHQELRAQRIELLLSSGVTQFADADGRVSVRLSDDSSRTADLVILAVGVQPESDLARTAGLTLTPRGAIVVDEFLRTSDPHIYAVGDAVETHDPILGGQTVIPLAGPANRQARYAIDNIFGQQRRYRGTLGTSVVRLFGLTAASTGHSEKSLKRAEVPYAKVYVHRPQHAGYFPGAQPMMIKLLYAPDGSRLFGAQIVGGDGVDKRIDVLATALQAGLSVADLMDLELAYAPQYGAAKDPVNIAGYVASGALAGEQQFVFAEELDEARLANWTILDVREPAEFAAGHVPGARLIPLGELRDRIAEIPRDKPLAVYCAVGQRGYYAARILRGHGLRVQNLAGGFTTYRLVHRRG
jgi:NADPH-dependent 2,4-dienoyl-CoA reductase/sulfur reductase-like enzyme/rhodanese-related sulfurtransferase